MLYHSYVLTLLSDSALWKHVFLWYLESPDVLHTRLIEACMLHQPQPISNHRQTSIFKVRKVSYHSLAFLFFPLSVTFSCSRARDHLSRLAKERGHESKVGNRSHICKRPNHFHFRSRLVRRNHLEEKKHRERIHKKKLFSCASYAHYWVTISSCESPNTEEMKIRCATPSGASSCCITEISIFASTCSITVPHTASFVMLDACEVNPRNVLRSRLTWFFLSVWSSSRKRWPRASPTRNWFTPIWPQATGVAWY